MKATTEPERVTAPMRTDRIVVIATSTPIMVILSAPTITVSVSVDRVASVFAFANSPNFSADFS